ncbi:hypothetical protein BDA99DRAFT_540206 [Phascolomyces articulosus]|uniref:Uncharacterized protein n=1 Tax=Phascolomyces articulosus TaxID=60185 RepID=A0AAD5K3L3_9FUNG|nr:hypothetical protein BDA99DRAFT_540206 [Phascolomyces articulosus]
MTHAIMGSDMNNLLRKRKRANGKCISLILSTVSSFTMFVIVEDGHDILHTYPPMAIKFPCEATIIMQSNNHFGSRLLTLRPALSCFNETCYFYEGQFQTSPSFSFTAKFHPMVLHDQQLKLCNDRLTLFSCSGYH